VSRRASLPGADELFRRTSSERGREARNRETQSQQVAKSPKLQVASKSEVDPGPKKTPRHEEKVTFYCTRDDLMTLEKARLALRADYGVAADRGKIVRAALAYVLEDFEARAEDSVLLRNLGE
jgi:hypothetical protein